MKTKLRSPFIGLVLMVGLAQIQTVCAALTFSITPAAVSNTYNGTITLQIDGLTNGETVVIQKYLDVNTNGVIDSNDLMVEDFQLTVGQTGATVIGGVTNVNVPFNSNTNTNAITATLNFQDGDLSQTIAGQYLFELSTPSGQRTNSLAVTDSYAQKLTGAVLSGADPVPNAVVFLVPASGGLGNGIIGSAVADDSGFYTIEAPVGVYGLVAFKNNFVGDATVATNLVLTSGETLATNLNLVAATESISGKIVDAAASNGLPGVLVVFTAAPSLFGLGFTDTNGGFTVGVTSNQWSINGADHSVALLGYVGLNHPVKVSATNGSVSNVTIPEIKATALFYGYLTDNLGNPLAGVSIESEDIRTVYDSFGSTDANGYYVTAALGGLDTNDAYEVNIGNDNLYPNYIFAQSLYTYGNGGTNTAVDTALMVNLSAIYSGLVLNGGFQTGDFTDWTSSGDTNNTYVDEGYYSGITPYFGRYEAALGTSGSLGYLSQTLSTTPGAAYLLSFWFDNPYADAGEFLVSWNGDTLLDTMILTADDWTNMQFVVSATGTSAVLQFGFEDHHNNLGLDDISVVSANPGIASVSLSGANLVLNGINGRSGGTYYVLTSTDLFLPLSQWTPVATNVLSAGGNFTIAFTNAVSPAVPQSFFILETQ